MNPAGQLGHVCQQPQIFFEIRNTGNMSGDVDAREKKYGRPGEVECQHFARPN